MIRVDALVLLLLLEGMAIFAVLAAIFFHKNRKHRRLYRKMLSDFMNLKGSSSDLSSGKHAAKTDTSKQEGTAAEKAVDDKVAQLQKERDALAVQVAELERMMHTDNKRFEDLQKKHATLEDEYSILYGKHFEKKGGTDPA